MRCKSEQSGFSAVELLITLFIASVFLISGFELYAAIIKNGGDARMMASASNVVTDYMQQYKSTATNPCTVQTPLTNSSIPVSGLSNVTVTVAIQCPYSSGTYSQGTTPNTVSEIIATVQYGTPQQTVSNATYVSNPNSGLITNGLVLNLDAGSADSYPGSGTTWTDLSGNGNNGTLVNGPTYSATNGGVLSFNGTNNYVNVTDSASFNTKPLTVCAWVRPASFSNYQSILAKQRSGDNFEQIGLLVDSTGNVAFQSGASGTSLKGPLSLNTWAHICGSSNGTTVTIYINGQALGTGGDDSTYGATKPFRIGNTQWGGDARYFNGFISIILIYNRALSPSEVNQDYNALKSRYSL